MDNLMEKTISFCNNCGKYGHYYHQCKKPITSIGVILFRNNRGVREYLMICRRNTLGYVDFVRGKYPLYQKCYLSNIISEMTNDEKRKLLTQSFDELWMDLWGDDISNYHNEERMSRNKFRLISEGIKFGSETILLSDLIHSCKSDWRDPEWGFPKGRRNYLERDINCAIREFEEECGYSRHDISIVSNIMPYEEIFIGSNIKCYKHKYYVAYTDRDNKNAKFQESEVSDMRWLPYDDCINTIRSYNHEKIEILRKVENTLRELSLCV